MDLNPLRDLLTMLRECGVRRARGVKLSGHVVLEEVEFEAGASLTPVTPGGVVDADGKPVDFDADLPELARDPIHAANFPGKS